MYKPTKNMGIPIIARTTVNVNINPKLINTIPASLWFGSVFGFIYSMMATQYLSIYVLEYIHYNYHKLYK